MKLSIIIPIYNVEDYLRKCVDSLICQDFADYEIILVDDGSTDGSGELCDEIVRVNDEMSRTNVLNEPLSLNDGRYTIRVIHQKNGGLSAARNSGIEAAKGEYIMFVDSDDYIEPNALGGLMEQVERENLDVLRYDYRNVRIVNSEELIVKSKEGDVKYELFEPNKTPRCIDRGDEVVDGITYLNTRMRYACYAWQFIVRKDIVNSFTPGLHFEDVDWLPRMMLKAKRVNSTPLVVYNYFWREGSITLTQGDRQKIHKNLEDRLLIIDKYRQYIEQFPNCKWLRNMQSSMVSGVLTDVAREFYIEREEYINRLKEMMVFPLFIADQGKTYKRRAIIINIIGPNVFCMLIHFGK